MPGHTSWDEIKRGRTHQILCGGDPEIHFDRLGIDATRTFEGVRDLGTPYTERWTVWELSEDMYQTLLDAPGDEEEFWWRGNGSWWRLCGGSNLGPCNARTTIQGQKLRAWNPANEFTDIPFNWTDIFEYLSHCIGATTERNVAACLTDLAAANNMSVGELLTLTFPRRGDE